MIRCHPRPSQASKLTHQATGRCTCVCVCLCSSQAIMRVSDVPCPQLTHSLAPVPLPPAESIIPQAGIVGDMRISYAKFLQLLEADRVKRVVVYGDMKTAVVEVSTLPCVLVHRRAPVCALAVFLGQQSPFRLYRRCACKKLHLLAWATGLLALALCSD